MSGYKKEKDQEEKSKGKKAEGEKSEGKRIVTVSRVDSVTILKSVFYRPVFLPVPFHCAIAVTGDYKEADKRQDE